MVKAGLLASACALGLLAAPVMAVGSNMRNSTGMSGGGSK